MALQDTPQIDKPSINSDISQTRLLEQFSQQAGFISRTDVPDKGCDYDVELIVDGTNVSGWRFAVQLKSLEKLNLVSEQQFISYSFETSRLGYLLRRLPGMGLIVLYSVERDQLFYEYVENVIYRLEEERDSTSWKQNQSVNIRVPVVNTVNAQTTREIHKTFTNRFQEAARMQASHGKLYGLPTINIASDQKYDWNSLADIKKILIDFGLAYLVANDLQIVFQLISKVPNQQIYADLELLKIAAVAYSEVGSYADSNIFCQRLKKQPGLSQEDHRMIQFTMLKNNLALGVIERAEYINTAKRLKTSEDGYNNIVLDINILFYELQDIGPFEDISKELEEEVRKIDERISTTLTDGTSKNLLKLWNAENYGYIAGIVRSNSLRDLRMIESMGGGLSLQEKGTAIKKIMDAQLNFLLLLDDLLKRNESDKWVVAFICLIHTRFNIVKEVDFLSFDVRVDRSKHQKILQDLIAKAQLAHHLFADLNSNKESYDALCYCFELIELSNAYGYTSQYDLEELSKVKNAIELQMDFPKYEAVVPKLVIQLKKEKEGIGRVSAFSGLKNLNDDALHHIAVLRLKALNLNEDRLKNIEDEIKAFRLFSNRCTDDNIQVLIVKSTFDTEENQYMYPVKFVLQNTETGIVTQESSDMDQLLKTRGM